MANRNWVRLGELKEETLGSLMEAVGRPDGTEPQRLKKLASILPSMDCGTLIKHPLVGWGTLKTIVGWYYRTYPTSRLVKSFFETRVSHHGYGKS